MSKFDQAWQARKSNSAGSKAFLDFVGHLMTSEGLNREAAWNEARRRRSDLYRGMTSATASNERAPQLEALATPLPAGMKTSVGSGNPKTMASPQQALRAQKFGDLVRQLMESQRMSYEEAWKEARRRYPQAFEEMSTAANELPPASELSQDGQRLTPDWPVSPAVLGALGLPTGATREMFTLYRLAETVTSLEPAVAAKIIVTLIRFGQLTGGSTFTAMWDAVGKHFPDLFAALKRAGVTPAAAPQQQAANEIGAEVMDGLGPDLQSQSRT